MLSIGSTIAIAAGLSASLPAAPSSFELRGSIPVACDASIAVADRSGETVTLVVSESCNTFYALTFRFRPESGARDLVFANRRVPIQGGVARLTRQPFDGSRSGTAVTVTFETEEQAIYFNSVIVETTT